VTRVLTSLSAVFAAYFLTAIPAAAATSAWADLGGGKARLVADFDPSSNKIIGGIEVKLDKGWSTYWRYPGSTGIPPLFDFSSSQNISFGDVEFPTPGLQQSGDAHYAGYKNTVTFPFSGDVSAGRLPSLNVDMLIGVCEEICIPAKANITIASDQFLQSDPVAKRILSFAKLKMPKKLTSEEASLDMVRLSDKILEVSLASLPGDNSRPNLFVEGPYDWYLTPATFSRENDGRLIFHLDLTNIPKEEKISGAKLKLTFVSGSKGYEIQD